MANKQVFEGSHQAKLYSSLYKDTNYQCQKVTHIDEPTRQIVTRMCREIDNAHNPIPLQRPDVSVQLN